MAAKLARAPARSGKVLHLVPRRSEDKTVEVLEAALNRARRGGVAGIVLTLMEPGSEEFHVRTGVYKDRPAEAIRAVLSLSMLLTENSRSVD